MNVDYLLFSDLSWLYTVIIGEISDFFFFKIYWFLLIFNIFQTNQNQTTMSDRIASIKAAEGPSLIPGRNFKDAQFLKFHIFRYIDFYMK